MVSALVLGAGGITGIAWHLGLIIGLREAGVDVTDADVVVGTSAGAVAGALIAAGLDPAEAQRIEAGAFDLPLQPDWVRGAQAFALLNDDSRDKTEIRAAVGALALAADVVAEEVYVDALSRRLPIDRWPERLQVTAVDAATGVPVVWDRASGVPLKRAVAASCAVPCVFPPVTVDGSRYVDGGVRSGTNADVAATADRIVVLAPLAPVRMRGAPTAEIDALRQRSQVVLLAPDGAALSALGPNVFDSSRWDAAIDAATTQGRLLAPEVARVWSR